MKFPELNLLNPIYVKTHGDMVWPQENFFYLLTATGLFMCRNYPFFRSCVPARSGPKELARQEVFLEYNYPKVPRPLLESAVGFFATIGERHNAEAAVVLAWDSRKERVRLLVPKQRSTVYRSTYGSYPLGVHYELPAQLPEGWHVMGDIHSHVDGAAYASFTDERDEIHRPGLHIVVGRIREEPPEFHVEATVDGNRFKVELELAIEGYRRRTEVSQGFLDQVEIVHVLAMPGHWNNCLVGNSTTVAGGNKNSVEDAAGDDRNDKEKG